MSNVCLKNLANLFPKHKASLSLEHNGHKNCYESIEDWEEVLKRCCGAKTNEQLGWISEEQRAKAIREDSFWELQWYPNTPICFNRLLACDLDALLEYAQAMKEE